MKKSHIVLILLIAGIVGTFIASFMNTSTSVNFEEAFANPGTEFKVSGFLDKSQEVIYDPQSDHSTTIFYMIDKNDNVKKVHLKQAKPQGLERSESVDLYGKVIDGEFYASDILMKCPSKYNENNHLIETAEAIN